MHWLKRDIWKAGIAVAGLLIILVFMVWVPVSYVGAYEGTSGLADVGNRNGAGDAYSESDSDNDRIAGR